MDEFRDKSPLQSVHMSVNPILYLNEIAERHSFLKNVEGCKITMIIIEFVNMENLILSHNCKKILVL